MIEFGNTLRAAREARGLTTADIAQKTHMMVQMVENLEIENFTRIAAPIYGRGFVKLYCEAVGLDPKPLVDEFMEIYNGNRTPTIRMRKIVSQPAPQPAPEPAPEPTPEPEPELPPAVPTPEPEPALPPEEEPPEPEPELPPQPIATEPPSPPDESLFAFARTPEVPTAPAAPRPVSAPARPSRYAAPSRKPSAGGMPAGFRIPPAAWRILVLAVGALLVLWLLFVGVRALYRATMTAPAAPQPAAEAPAAPTIETPVAPAASGAAVPRKPMDIPDLYID